MYELALRVKEGIPFPTLMVIALIIESALARAQRDGKVMASGNFPAFPRSESFSTRAELVRKSHL